MGRALHQLNLPGNLSMQERACEEYTCRSCGKKMISVNFVNGIAIQVFAVHGVNCEYHSGNGGQRTVCVSCDTCLHHSDKGCAWTGIPDAEINSVRTQMTQLL